MCHHVLSCVDEGKAMATFKILSEFEGDGGVLPLTCTECGADGDVPTGGRCRIEAVVGMGFVWDPMTPPPDGFVPRLIKCRRCHYVYEMGEKADVR